MQKLFNKYLKEIQDEIIRIKKESKEIQTMNNYWEEQISDDTIWFSHKYKYNTYFVKKFNSKGDLIYTHYRTPKGTIVVKNDGTIDGLIKDDYDGYKYGRITRIFTLNDGKTVSAVREIEVSPGPWNDKLIQDIYYKKDGRTVESIKKY